MAETLQPTAPAAEQPATKALRPRNGVLMLLGKYKNQIERAIPRQYLSPERMLNLVVNALNKNPDLLQCAPVTVVNAIMHIAQIGLEIRPGEAYLVPFGKECVPIIDYRGKIKVARRGGFVRDVIADVVYSNDMFSYSVSDKAGRTLSHVPLYLRAGTPDPNAPMVRVTKEDRGLPILAYMIAWLKGEERPHIEVMWYYQIEEVRAMSKQSGGLMWTKSWDEAAKKTVIHRGLKLLAHDDETMHAQDIDDRVEAGITLDNIIDVTSEDEKEAEHLNQSGQAAAATDERTEDLKKRLQKRGAKGQDHPEEAPRRGATTPGEATGGGAAGPAVSGSSADGAEGEGRTREPGVSPPTTTAPSSEPIREVEELPDPLSVQDERLFYKGNFYERNDSNTFWRKVTPAAKQDIPTTAKGGGEVAGGEKPPPGETASGQQPAGTTRKISASPRPGPTPGAFDFGGKRT